MNIMYGGTKEEMERLVKDAAKIDKTFKYNTKTVVKNKKAVTELDMSYADIVQAIHIVQTNMGITGTTAEEASKTISGSINMLKAAWSNLVTGMGEGDEKKLDKLVDDVVDAAKTALNNVLPVAEKALYGILHLVEASVPVFARELPGLISRLLPTVVKAAGALLVGLAQALPALLTSVLNAIRTKVVPQIAEVLGGIVGAGKNSSLVNHLTKNIQRVWKDISGILKSIGDGAKKFWSGTLQPVLVKILNFITKKVLLGIHNGIIKLRPVIEQITPIIKKVSDFVSSVWANTLSPMLNDALKFITESWIPNVMYWIRDRIIPTVSDAVNKAIDLWNTKLEPVVMTIWETLVNKVGPAIIDAIQWVMDHLDTILPIVGGIVAGIGAFMIGKKIMDTIGTIQKLFGVIMAHPFALILAAIGAVIGYLVHLYQTNEEARDKINAAFEAIKGFWENTLKPAFEAIYTYVVETLIPTVIDWFENQFKPAVERTFTAIEGFWNDTLKPALEAIYSYVVETLIPTLIDWWENHLKPSIEGVFTAIAGFWENTLKPALVALFDYVYRDLIPTLIVAWEYDLQPAIERVFGAIAGFWNDTLKPAFEAIYSYVIETLVPELVRIWTEDVQPTFETVFGAIAGFWNDTLKPALEALWGYINDNIVPIMQTLGEKFDEIKTNYLEPVATWVKDTLLKVWEDLQGGLNGLVTFLTGVFTGDWQKAWDGLVAMIETPFNLLKDILKTPINAVIGLINSMIFAVRDAINKVIDGINSHVRIKLDPIFVLGKKVWDGIDVGVNLQKVNWSGIKKLAKGGILGDGQSAFVGEYAPELLRVIGGKAMVTPLSKVPARFPGGGQEMTVPRYTAPKNLNVVLKIKDTEIARVLLPLLDTEEQRVGLKLAKGGAY